jgi:hypothetical protein
LCEARVKERMKTVEGMTEIETVHVPWSSRMNGDGAGASRDEMGPGFVGWGSGWTVDAMLVGMMQLAVGYQLHRWSQAVGAERYMN